jgi:hypothetical protein
MNREELLESYFEGLYTISNKPDMTIENLEIPPQENSRWSSMNGKPFHALWLAKGLSWHNWNQQSNYMNTDKMYLYRVKLKKNAKILQLKNGIEAPPRYIVHHPEDEKIFGGSRNYVPQTIDFEKISKQYDGVSAYHIKGPFQSWDVPTVAVFNKNVVESITPMGKVKDAIRQRNTEKKPLGESYAGMIKMIGAKSYPEKFMVFKLNSGTAASEMLEAGKQGGVFSPATHNPSIPSIRFIADGSTNSVYVFSDELVHEDVMRKLNLTVQKPNGDLKQMMLGYAYYNKDAKKWEFQGYSWISNKAGEGARRLEHKKLYNKKEWGFLNRFIPLPETYI